MSTAVDPPRGASGYWRTVLLLLSTARRRAAGRRNRQQELMRRRTKKPTTNLGCLATLGTLLLMVVIHGVAASVVSRAVTAGQRLAVEQAGKVVVDPWFKKDVEAARQAADMVAAVRRAQTPPGDAAGNAVDALYGKQPRAAEPPWKTDDLATATRAQAQADIQLEQAYRTEADQLTREYGGQPDVVAAALRAAVRQHGTAELVLKADAFHGLADAGGSHSLPAMLGSIVLLWWAAMLVLQGEGLELDLQRRRHPMWEWLYSHPVSAAAIFTAEILSPLAANPVYWGAPLFVGVLYGMAYDFGIGVIAAGLAGVPIAVAAACLGKALEIAAVIRFSPRTRGALLGLMSWGGYASMMLLLLGISTATVVATAVGRTLAPLTALPWPWLGWFLGWQADGTFSFPAGMLACWLAAGVVTTLAVRVCVWGTRRGLSGGYGGTDTPVATVSSKVARFGRDPLYRKEFLWFARDRSAVVQTILIPLTIAGFQVYNLRGAVQHAQSAWNYLCGAAILFGTYFLWVLGPKSLASEGSALWLALTWPRGLESLLKAKAWLWSLISTGLVVLVLSYAVYLFPADAWKVALVGVGWLFFARSMADKTVTLVTVTSESGDAEPITRSRRWAASLGMLTFAIGVLTQQWSLAVVGVVYSSLTAAAMWESFRARLPFLYDPWSETLPPPPTLLHAMVSISILVEGTAVVSAPVLAITGREYIAIARSVVYALCALVISFGVADFLNARGVQAADVWCWRGGAQGPLAQVRVWWCGDGSYGFRFVRALLVGAVGGLVLGLLAHGYIALAMHVPSLAELIRHSREQMDQAPGLKASYAFCAVAVAPFAEEYLFRGLLFRALDREWGGWRAVVGSAAFFAIYHPPLSWLPVGLLGAANALLFKRTGRLLPAVVLHVVYNAVVLR